jgi:hypothetical protein
VRGQGGTQQREWQREERVTELDESQQLFDLPVKHPAARTRVMLEIQY